MPKVYWWQTLSDALRLVKGGAKSRAGLAEPGFRPVVQGPVVVSPAIPRRYRPTATLTASFALHAAAIGSVAIAPHQWRWWLGAMLADQAALAAIGSWPRSRLLGPNLRRLDPSRAGTDRVALTFDDGPDPGVTPRVLDLLDATSARATFFCIGRRAVAHPRLVEEIVARGHSVQNHTFGHSFAFAFYGPRRLGRELDRAQDVLGGLAGVTCRYFRAPAGARSPYLEPLLVRRGLELVSWTRRGFDAVSRDRERIVDRLVGGLAPGDILLLHDGRLRETPSSAEPPVLEVLPRLLQVLERRGLRSIALTSEIGLP